MRASSDTPTHLELYRAFPCGAIVHTHSEYATMFAQARSPIRCLGTTHADYFRGDIPVTRALTQLEVDGDYEANTGKVIVETFRPGISPEEIPAVLVANHAPFTWRPDAATAIEHARVLEFVATSARAALLPAAAPFRVGPPSRVGSTNVCCAARQTLLDNAPGRRRSLRRPGR